MVSSRTTLPGFAGLAAAAGLMQLGWIKNVRWSLPRRHRGHAAPAHLRRAGTIGLAKTHLQHVLTAAAVSLDRIRAGIASEPCELTRLSDFTPLMAAPDTA